MIKLDIPMPESCNECVFKKFNGYEFFCPFLLEKGHWCLVTKYEETRSPNCPLIVDSDKTDILANLREDIDLLTHDRQPTAEEMKIVNDISAAIAMLEEQL